MSYLTTNDDIERFELIESREKQFKDKLDEYDQAFYLILNEISPSYYNYRRNPDDTLYLNNINKLNNGLQNSKTDLFLLSNELENKINDIKEKTNKLNELIDNININNKEINNEYTSLIESSNSSKGRLKEHKNIYKFRLIDIILILLLIIYMLYYLYSINQSGKVINILSNISNKINIPNISNIGNKIKNNAQI